MALFRKNPVAPLRFMVSMAQFAPPRARTYTKIIHKSKTIGTYRESATDHPYQDLLPKRQTDPIASSCDRPNLIVPLPEQPKSQVRPHTKPLIIPPHEQPKTQAESHTKPLFVPKPIRVIYDPHTKG